MLKLCKMLIAGILVATGLHLFLFGDTWAPTALELLAGSEIGAWLELLVPFLPMLCIGLGAALFVSNR